MGQKYINCGEKEQEEIQAYKRNPLKYVAIILLCILSLGSLALVFYWKPTWFLKATSDSSSLSQATHVLLQDKWKDETVEVVEEETMPASSEVVPDQKFRCIRELYFPDKHLPSNSHCNQQRYFMHKKHKFVWHSQHQSFTCLRLPPLKCSYFHQQNGLNQDEAAVRLRYYGQNFIEVKLTPILVILITQALTPFYIFQLYSTLLWIFAEAYYYYSGCIIVMSVLSLTATVYQINLTERNLKSTITASGEVMVKRTTAKGYKSTENEFVKMSTIHLVPGDVIEIPDRDFLLHCDAVLVSGSVVVNEGMLTGESVPITKTSISTKDDFFIEHYNNKSLLYGGTTVLQARSSNNQSVRAVVIRTGFYTTKGFLVRSIMYPKSMDFKFVRDSYKYIAALTALCSVGMVYTGWIMVKKGFEVGRIVIRVCDLITIVVPPSLPAAMTFCIAVSQYRLRKKNIFCFNSKSIILGGNLDAFCFDKTGTLTEEGLDLCCVHPASQSRFTDPVRIGDANKMHIDMDRKLKELNDSNTYLILCMASCHSLAFIDGRLSGDPLDLKIFEFTKWTFTDKHQTSLKTPVSVCSNQTQKEYGLAKELPFSSELQRMAVVTHHQTGTEGSQHHFTACVKGSPEMIQSLCLPESVPSDFQHVLVHYTEQGFRTLALAYKPLYHNIVEADVDAVWKKLNLLERDEVEHSLHFLGLVVLENRVKAESPPTILKLQMASFKTVMVTGDNLLTALSVAEKCNFLYKPVYLASIALENDQPFPTFCSIDEMNRPSQHFTRFNIESDKVENRVEDNFHIAITGKMWKQYIDHFPHLITKLVVKGVVFARFSPEQKQQLIERLQSIGYYVGMCGDGANDCGALKAAHAGIALSDTEASVAAPFSCKENNIHCVDVMLREGRCALTTSYGIFKLVAFFSLNQFILSCFFLWEGGTITDEKTVRETSVENGLMSDFQFMYQDIFLMIPMSITFCFISRHDQIIKRKPPISLVALAPILSLLLGLFISIAAMVFVMINCTYQPWYSADPVNYRLTCLFLAAITHDVSMAIVFTRGPPFQKHFISNFWFVVAVLLTSLANYLTIMLSNDWWSGLMEMTMPPSNTYRGIIAGVTVLHFFVAYLVEKVFVEKLIEENIQPYLSKRFFAKECKYEEAWEGREEEELDWKVVETNYERFMANESSIDELLIKVGNMAIREEDNGLPEVDTTLGYDNDGFNNSVF